MFYQVADFAARKYLVEALAAAGSLALLQIAEAVRVPPAG